MVIEVLLTAPKARTGAHGVSQRRGSVKDSNHVKSINWRGGDRPTPKALLSNGKDDVTRHIANMRTPTVKIVAAAPALPVPLLAAA
jgi:hypothetical protein